MVICVAILGKDLVSLGNGKNAIVMLINHLNFESPCFQFANVWFSLILRGLLNGIQVDVSMCLLPELRTESSPLR